MKVIYISLISILLVNCSFDNKSGIWKNENYKNNEEKNIFEEFKKISLRNKDYNKKIILKNDFNFVLSSVMSNFQWKDIYYAENNNTDNFEYKNLNQIIFKSKKLTKYNVNNFLLYENDNLILSDQRGNIIIFSTINNSIIAKFNFYKKKYKKIKMKLNMVVENNIIYISDNLGYFYAYNYLSDKILWAKNFKIPFRSNLKYTKYNIYASNQNNDLLILKKQNGALIKTIPTEDNIVKNNFVNNLSISDDDILFYLNSYGSLYSINSAKFKINWFLNLNQASELNPSNLFFGNQIVNNNQYVIISSNENTYIIDKYTGQIRNKFNFASYVKPILNKNYIFFVSNNNYLISINLNTGKILYSYNIDQKISDFLKIDKQESIIKNFFLLNSEIFIFLENSYLLQFNIKGELKKTKKLPIKIQNNPIIIDGSVLYLSKQNKLIVSN